ncbi:MAG: electron transfer flavoprotein subunit alpha/FixB family protein [Clostridia bacterium]|nr:electron transfer flavoprotein subunit alpha/FixB family protein [Clostridia bacterium]
MERIKKAAIWVYCETQDKKLLPVGMQLIGKAKELAEKCKSPLYAVVIGAMPENGVQTLLRCGADEVIHSDGAVFENKLEKPYADAVIELAQRFEPNILLVGATCFGRAFAPRVASALGTGLTADCTLLDIEEGTNLLLQTRPAFGGNMMATIRTVNERPQMATVRPGVFPLPEAVAVTKTEAVTVKTETAPSLVELLRETVAAATDDVSKSKIIVAAGRGIGSKKNLKLVEDLAAKLGGSVGATRPLVDMGYCPYSCQIGQTGVSVAPDLLICCGISGAVQHLAGIGGAKNIIAINQDPEAPIFAVADYKIVGDCIPVLEALLAALD